jgi:hypothetical protein
MRPSTAILALIALLSGCATMDPPAGYVSVKHSATHDYKAVSAKGCVIAMTRHENPDSNADLSFWTQAVEHQKVDLDGMKLTARDDLKSNAGADGVLLRFESGEGQGRLVYLIGLFVSRMNLSVIEATGPADELEKDMPKLKESILTIR